MLGSGNSYITMPYIKKGLNMEYKGKLFMEHSETFYGNIYGRIKYVLANHSKWKAIGFLKAEK